MPVATLARLLRRELQQLTTVQASNRPWHLPVAAALASGLPLLVAAHYGQLAPGLVACYALGTLSHFVPWLMMPTLVFTAVLMTMVCRACALGPPGSLRFIMAASLGAYTPSTLAQVPQRLGLVVMGGMGACQHSARLRAVLGRQLRRLGPAA